MMTTFQMARQGQHHAPAPWFRLEAEYRPSTLPGAGLGVFALTPARRGTYLGSDFPIPERVRTSEQVGALPESHRRYSWRHIETVCFAPNPDFRAVTDVLNHAFDPNVHCHVGHYFALKDIEVGDELFVDYRYWWAEDWHEALVDARTGQTVRGWPWAEALHRSCLVVAELMTCEGAMASADRTTER